MKSQPDMVDRDEVAILKESRARAAAVVLLTFYVLVLDFLCLWWMEPFVRFTETCAYLSFAAGTLIILVCAIRLGFISRAITRAGVWHLMPAKQKVVLFKMRVPDGFKKVMLISLLFLVLGYIGSYLYLSRTARAEARLFNGVAYLFRPPWSRTYSSNFHVACVFLYRPLIAIDVSVLRNIGPASYFSCWDGFNVDDLTKE